MTERKTKGTPDEVDVHIGQRLRVRRSLLGMTQEKLAAAVGITFQQIQKYERGTNRVSAGRLFHFSKALDVPITYFYEQAGLHATNDSNSAPAYGLSDNKQAEFEGPSSSAPDDVMMRKETFDLVRVYYSIEDEEARKDIMKFIKSMAGRLS